MLGAQAIGNEPSIILLGRINAAACFLKRHPNSVCIAAGGQGSDETESEAKCIKDYLTSRYGIEAKRIYTDDQSKSTSQNFDNAIKIIKRYNLSDNVAVATDGFHMFRAKLLAQRKGLNAYACPAVTDKRLVLTFYIRELFALPKTVLFNQ
ncbi:MAG TPA: YdcF family protein [Clostridia bacterium]|nr:YdcF family protein [Clostridia bacterium]